MPGIWGHGKNKMPLPRMAVGITRMAVGIKKDCLLVWHNDGPPVDTADIAAQRWQSAGLPI